MLQTIVNIRPYRRITSDTMISQLLDSQEIIMVQRDELKRLQNSRTKRPLYKEEREYVVRMYQDVFGMKSKSKPNTNDTKEHEIHSYEDISFLN